MGTAEFTGFDASIQQDRIDNLHTLLQGLYPDIASSINKSSMKPWAGLRPISCDGKPFIGSCDIAGLYFIVGHGHLGWTMAMGAAHILADIMAGRPPSIDNIPFQLKR